MSYKLIHSIFNGQDLYKSVYYLTFVSGSKIFNKKITRREAISTAAKIGIGTAVGIAVGFGVSYLMLRPPTVPPTATIVKKGYFWGDSPYEMNSEWYIALNRAMLYYAEYLGDRVLTLDPRASQEDQTRHIKYMIAQGVDGIMCAPCTPEGAVAVIEEAVSKGIPVVTYDSSANTKKISISIMVDNYKMGQQLGEEFIKMAEKEKIKIEGTVFVIRDVAENPVQMNRAKGFIDVIKKNYPVNVLEFGKSGGVEVGKELTTEAILAHGKPNMIMATNLLRVLGAAEALKSLNLAIPRGKEGHIPLVGIDSSPSLMPLIEEGIVDLVMDQPSLFYGTLALKCLRIIKEQGENALPEIGQTIISDPSKKPGPQPDGTYNLFIEDIEAKGVHPFRYPLWAPTVCSEMHGHRWIVCKAIPVTPENYKTIPVWSNVVMAWFYGK